MSNILLKILLTMGNILPIIKTIRMETEELLVTLSYTTNRGLNQLKFLFDLCDNDFNKLFELEAYMHRTYKYACPGDKETVDKYLKEWKQLRAEDNENKNKK